MQRIGKQIRLTVTDAQEERIKIIAKRHGIPKARVYRNMIDVGLDLYDDFEKIGVYKLVEFTEKAKDLGKGIFSSRQKTLF